MRRCMVLAWCVWRCCAEPAIEIAGEISFDLRISAPETTGADAAAAAAAAAAQQADIVPRGHAANITVAPPVECIYQYPETRQVEAMLSNMMNQLTKVFIRVHKYMYPKETRREAAKRFKVVRSKKSDFFDHIYANMTEEYRRFANETWARVPRSGSDPCLHQAEIRDVWRALLDTSQRSLRRAALQCVEEYLAAARCRSRRVRARAAALLRRELARVRTDQLALLCDSFQLCYNELL